MKVEWFLYINSNVSGPFTTQEIREKLDRGQISSDTHIWWKGQQEWLPIRAWESYIEDNNLEEENSDQKKIWNLKIHEKTILNINLRELVEKLKGIQNYTHVSVRKTDSAEWENIYARQEILTELGLSRRKFLRAPLMGSARIIREGSRFSYVVKTASLGQGGIGFLGQGTNITINSNVTMKVESPDLTGPLNVSGTVMYMLKSGYIGIKFSNTSAESQTIIMDYLKKFDDNKKSAA